MLPFMKKNDPAGAGLITKRREPDKTEEKPMDGMEMAAKDLHDAVKSGDIEGIASALRAACQIADSEPHVEGPQEDDDLEG